MNTAAQNTSFEACSTVETIPPLPGGAARRASSRHLACISGCFARKYTAQERDFAVVSEPARNRLQNGVFACSTRRAELDIDEEPNWYVFVVTTAGRNQVPLGEPQATRSLRLLLPGVALLNLEACSALRVRASVLGAKRPSTFNIMDMRELARHGRFTYLLTSVTISASENTVRLSTPLTPLPCLVKRLRKSTPPSPCLESPASLIWRRMASMAPFQRDSKTARNALGERCRRKHGTISTRCEQGRRC